MALILYSTSLSALIIMQLICSLRDPCSSSWRQNIMWNTAETVFIQQNFRSTTIVYRLDTHKLQDIIFNLSNISLTA